MNKYKNVDLRKFLELIPHETILKKNKQIIDSQIAEHNLFKESLNKNEWYLCKGKMNEFNKLLPSLHWFSYPPGIKKKHFKSYLDNSMNFGFFNLDAYFRWIANSGKALGNINDLSSDTSETSFIETTYKYNNIQWAFSIRHSDLEGHRKSQTGSNPHYHIEMKINDKVFIKFNDFHLPFNDEDLFMIELRKQAPDKIIKENLFGSGMSFLEDEKNIDLIDEITEVTDDYENATISYQSFILADENNPITSKIINEAIKESKKTKKPVGLILSQKLENAKSQIIISPGKSVPKMPKRSGKK